MGYLAMWKVLEEMSTDLRKKGATVPTKIMTELKSSRSLINILNSDPNRVDTVQKIEELLQNLEVYLVSEGENKFGSEYVERWLKRLNSAAKEVAEEDESETRFIVGAPRDQKWVRVQPSEKLTMEKLKSLADKFSLSHRLQEDGFLLVQGEGEHLKKFVKEMAKEARP